MKTNRRTVNQYGTWRVAVLSLVTALTFSACCQEKLTSTNRIDVVRIEALQRQIKEQIGAYLFYAHRARLKHEAALKLEHEKTSKGGASTDSDICDNGKSIDFLLDRVDLSVETDLTSTTDANLKLVAPLVASIFSASPSAEDKNVEDNDQLLNFSEFPLPDGYYENFFKKPINVNQLSTALIALHAGLLKSRDQAPCLTGINYISTPGTSPNNYTIGLKITNVGDVDIALGVGPISAGVSHDRQIVNNNKITISFRQIDLDTIPMIQADNPKVPSKNLSLFSEQTSIPGLAHFLPDGTIATSDKEPKFSLCKDENNFLFYCEKSKK